MWLVLSLRGSAARGMGNAVFRLNKHQKNRLLIFESDGTGRGVQWRERGGRATVE